MNYIKIIILLLLNVRNEYYFLIKNPIKLKEKAIIGGNPSLYLDLSENQFMVTFWFKIDEFLNKVFPFISLFNENKLLKQYIILKDTESLKENENFENNFFKLNRTTKYFCKFDYYNNSSKPIINLSIWTNSTNIFSINSELNIEINIKDVNFIINKLNLNEDITIENLTFYNNINEFSRIELINGVSNIIYFINFKNNYPNTKWLNNEIKNEFGPSLNGNSDQVINMFNSNFNNVNYEIEWFASNTNSEIIINPIISNYLSDFKIDFSSNIFLKLNFLLNFKYQTSDNTGYIEILNFFNNKLIIYYNYSHTEDKIKFILYTQIYSHTKTLLLKTINNKEFIENGNFNLNFIVLNMSKNQGSNKLNSIIYFKKNSVFCDTSCIFKTDSNFNGLFSKNQTKIYFNNNLTSKIIFIMKIYEFMIGKGNLKIENLKNNNFCIKSNNIENKFMIFNSIYEDIERRNSFNENYPHKLCSVDKCSICRKSINTCEFCYKGYYLNNVGNCILNSNNNKFVNMHSELVISDYNTLDGNIIYYSPNIYRILINIPIFYNFNLFNISINFDSNNNNNINFKLFSDKCCFLFSIFNNMLSYNISNMNVVLLTDELLCINKLNLIDFSNNTKELSNFNIKINQINNVINVNYKDIFCKYREGSNYYLKFDESLFFSYCQNSDDDYYFKNIDPFLYYSNCPRSCKSCAIDSFTILKCTSCKDGFILNNGGCIMNLIDNCNNTNNFSFKVNNILTVYKCKNNCISWSNDKIILSKFYNSNKTCNNNNVILGCKDPNKYFNYYNNNCMGCYNNNCSIFICNNCNNTNNNIPCSMGYKFYKNKCILLEYYDSKCTDYKLIDNKYKCFYCISNYFINVKNRCMLRNTPNCLSYLNNSITCNKCIDNYYLDSLYNCQLCSKYCKTCLNSSDYCLTCHNGFALINNKCNITQYNLSNCIIFNSLKQCIKCKNGFYLNNLNLCLICKKNCINCNDDKFCNVCDKNYNLNLNKECIKNYDNCYKQSLNICEKCYIGFYVNINNTCSKCSKNCMDCINKSDNCSLCFKDGLLIENFNKNIHYCKYKCTINQIYNYNLNNCTNCSLKIENFNQNQILSLKDLKIYDKIKSSIYLFKFNIPTFIDINLIDQEIWRKNISILFNNKSKVNYEIIIDWKYRYVFILPQFFTNLITFKVKLTIKGNIFNKFRECIFKNIELEYSIVLKSNKKLILNEFQLKNKILYPTISKDSEIYKSIEKYYEVTNISTNTVYIGSFIFSIFSPGILAKLSVFLPTLIFFNYLTILDIDYGIQLNTIFNFINFNSSSINLLNIDSFVISRKLNKLYTNNSKLIKIKWLKINNISLNYWVVIGFIIFFLFFLILIHILKFIKRIILMLKKKNDINEINDNNPKFFSEFSKKNITVINSLESKFVIEKKFMKYKLYLIYIKNFFIYYSIFLIISEIPNIVLVTIVYFSNFEIEFFTYSSVPILLILVINTAIIIFYFSLFYYVINNFYKENEFLNKMKINIIPFINKDNIYKNINKYIWLYKVIETLRWLLMILIIFFLNYGILFQICLIIILQIIFIFYMVLALNKGFIILAFIKENLVLAFLVISLKLYFSKNLILENIIFIICLIILILSLIELIVFYFKKLIILIKLLKVKKNKVKPFKIK